LLKHDPSAQSPWTNTMLGLLFAVVIAGSLLVSIESACERWDSRKH
jgi:hypothetical protein